MGDSLDIPVDVYEWIDDLVYEFNLELLNASLPVNKSSYSSEKACLREMCRRAYVKGTREGTVTVCQKNL